MNFRSLLQSFHVENAQYLPEISATSSAALSLLAPSTTNLEPSVVLDYAGGLNIQTVIQALGAAGNGRGNTGAGGEGKIMSTSYNSALTKSILEKQTKEISEAAESHSWLNYPQSALSMTDHRIYYEHAMGDAPNQYEDLIAPLAQEQHNFVLFFTGRSPDGSNPSQQTFSSRAPDGLIEAATKVAEQRRSLSKAFVQSAAESAIGPINILLQSTGDLASPVSSPPSVVAVRFDAKDIPSKVNQQQPPPPQAARSFYELSLPENIADGHSELLSTEVQADGEAKVVLSSNALEHLCTARLQSRFALPISVSLDGTVTLGDHLQANNGNAIANVNEVVLAAVLSSQHTKNRREPCTMHAELKGLSLKGNIAVSNSTSSGCAKSGERVTFSKVKLHFGLGPEGSITFQQFSELEIATMMCCIGWQTNATILVHHVHISSEKITAMVTEELTLPALQQLAAKNGFTDLCAWQLVYAVCNKLAGLAAAETIVAGEYVLVFDNAELRLQTIHPKLQEEQRWLSEACTELSTLSWSGFYLPPCTWASSTLAPFTFPPNDPNAGRPFKAADLVGTVIKHVSGDLYEVFRQSAVASVSEARASIGKKRERPV